MQNGHLKVMETECKLRERGIATPLEQRAPAHQKPALPPAQCAILNTCAVVNRALPMRFAGKVIERQMRAEVDCLSRLKDLFEAGPEEDGDAGEEA